MSRDFRFEPPSVQELEDMAYYDVECNHQCDDCEWNCEPEEEETMIDQIREIIRKYLNVEIIGYTEDPKHRTITFELYDHLDKPGNFEHDVKSAAEEIKAIYPESVVEPKFYNEQDWNGEEMKDVYNCILGIIGGR